MHADVLETEWSDADIVCFVTDGTCFDDRLWRSISDKAERLRGGRLFVSTSHVLSSSLVQVVETMRCTMSWGECTAYIHVRTSIWSAVFRSPDIVVQKRI